MEIYSITKIKVEQSDSSDRPDMAHVYLTDSDEIMVQVFSCPLQHLTECLVELGCKYEIRGNLGKLLDPHYLSMLKPLHDIFPSVSFHRDPIADDDCCVAQTKNGDTGHNECAYGKSFGQALANLARDHGFASTIDSNPIPTLGEWINGFNYGYQRMSDEQLALEMEAITMPNKGAW